jgi:uncharacterized RDD family membrane protein YckC
MQTVRVRTTQNVFIDHPVASVGDRILAYLIDSLVLFLYLFAAGTLLVQLDIDAWYVWLIILGIPFLFYFLVFEILMNGQTPGKRVMNIQVIQLNGTPATIGNYLLRWIFTPVDFMLSGVVAIICIAMGGKGQRVGDVVAGTSVVKLIRQEEITAHDVFVTPDQLHVPTFNQVGLLKDEDIELIQRALDVARTQGNEHPANMIAEKIKRVLNIESDRPAIEFLNTIVKDYTILSEGK